MKTKFYFPILLAIFFNYSYKIAAQTPYIVKDVNPGIQNGFSSGFIPFLYNGIFLFEGKTDNEGLELWRTDGTSAGTYMVKDINPGTSDSHPISFTIFNGIVYFSADGGGTGHELWRTDGTAAGTYLVKEFWPGTGEGLPNFFISWEHNNYFYFKAKGTAYTDDEIWKSDGTSAGTTILKDINPGTNGCGSYSFQEFNNELYFTADNGTIGKELWKTDGTTTGTVLVKDVNPGAGDGFGNFFGIFWQQNGFFYFTATALGGNDYELWKSDGTTTGTSQLKDINPGIGGSFPSGFILINNERFFRADDGTHGYELWKTDGTTAGTVLFKEFNVGSGDGLSGFGKYWEKNGFIYFVATSTGNDYEMWKTDGTLIGTTILKDINPGAAGSYPNGAVIFNNELFFSAENATSGRELWKTDGTTTGTVMVKDIYPGSSSGFNNFVYKVWEKNGFFYFVAVSTSVDDTEIWKTDGTTTGTTMVKNINPTWGSDPMNFFEFNNELVFRANDGMHGKELWKTDGTNAGTIMIKDVFAGIDDADPVKIAVYNGYFYFTAQSVVTGNKEIWKSDATASGTNMVMDIYPGITGSDPSYFYTLNNTYLLFNAITPTAGKELWAFNMPGIGLGEAENIPAISLNIFPNPASDYLTVTTSEKELHINLFDITGKLIKQFTTSGNSRLDVSDCIAGMYFLSCSNGTSVINKKIIIE